MERFCGGLRSSSAPHALHHSPKRNGVGLGLSLVLPDVLPRRHARQHPVHRRGHGDLFCGGHQIRTCDAISNTNFDGSFHCTFIGTNLLIDYGEGVLSAEKSDVDHVKCELRRHLTVPFMLELCHPFRYCLGAAQPRTGHGGLSALRLVAHTSQQLSLHCGLCSWLTHLFLFGRLRAQPRA